MLNSDINIPIKNGTAQKMEELIALIFFSIIRQVA